MAKHRVIGVNDHAGTVEMNGTKICKVVFSRAFLRKPSITITLEDSGSAHTPHRSKVKNTDFRIVFKNPYTGTVGWEAKEV